MHNLSKEQQLIYRFLDNSSQDVAIRLANGDNPRNAETAKLWLEDHSVFQEIEIARSTVQGKPDVVVTQIDVNSFDVEVVYDSGKAVINYDTRSAAMIEYHFSVKSYQQ